jgi:hypothetical protein
MFASLWCHGPNRTASHMLVRSKVRAGTWEAPVGHWSGDETKDVDDLSRTKFQKNRPQSDNLFT